MKQTFILLPVLVQISLTLWLYIRLASVKSAATAQGQVDESRRALHNDAWPDEVLQVNNAIRSQFEVPILFYVLCLILWQLQAVDFISLSVAVLFVLSRISHVVIHTGSNIVPLRRKAFSLGCIMVMLLTALSAYHGLF